jgi:hypothetical protein
MTVFLGFSTAYEFYHDVRVRRRPPTEPAGTCQVAGDESGACAVREALAVSGLSGLGRPVHVLASSAASVRRSREVASHIVEAALPRGSFVRVSPRLVAASPALSFVQAAQFLDPVGLVCFGMELAGTYCTGLHGEATVYRLAPVLSQSELACYVGQCPSVNGVKVARQMAHFVVDRSASPMETALYLLLCLPTRMGGYGFPLPAMNAPIVVNASAENGRDGGATRLRPDLYWPDRGVGLEYDSDQFHDEANRESADSSRRTLFAAGGATVRSVTRAQIYDVQEFHAVALALAKNMGRRLRFAEPAFSQARDRLRVSLLAGRAPVRGV